MQEDRAVDNNSLFSVNNTDTVISVYSGGYPDTSKPRLHEKDSGFIFEYVLSGEEVIESPDVLIHAGIGDLVIVRPGMECVLYRSSGDLRTIGFSLSGFVLEASCDVLGIPDIFCGSADVFDKILGIDKTYERYTCGDGSAGREILELAFSLILDAAVSKRQDVHTRPSGEAIKEFLDRCLCGDVDLDAVGKRFGITGMHVIRLFRAEYDETPMQYLKLSRLRKSAELLADTDMTIKEISSLLKFSSTQHFTNLFREQFGVSPGKFRENHK